MPLRDHFHPPLAPRLRWESFHSNWANQIVADLNLRLLPTRYRSDAETHLGIAVEIDVATFDEERPAGAQAGGGNGIATAVWAPPRATQTFAVDFPAQDVFEVRVYDDERGQRLVAAVELVSPGNKDRAENRRAFVVKCASLLQQRVSVVIVDIITDRRADLRNELLDMLGVSRSPTEPATGNLYAVALRTRKEDGPWHLDLWQEPVALGQPLPTLPLWLAADFAVPLELETAYEASRRALRIP
jgi:hypothetical protein